jgi:hypothetical protein
MKDVIVRWAQTIGCTAVIGGIVATSSGCGVLAAAANPKVAWAIKDPAPMSVVVRRADVAEKTAQQVDRVMTDTPANDDSAWLATVAPAKDDSAKTLADLRKFPLYAPGGPGAGSRIVPAEVWAKSLAAVEPKAAAGAASGATAPATASAKTAPKSDAPADPQPAAAPAAQDPADPVAKSADPAAKPGKGKKAAKPGSLAKADRKDGNKKGSKKAPIADKTAAADPTPAPAAAAAAAPDATPAPATVTVATPVSSKYPSLLAAIDADLGAAWADIMEKKKASGALKTQIAAEEAANDVKGVSEADKKEHTKNIDDYEKQAAKIDKEAEKLTDAFVPKAKAAAKKAPADVRDRFGAVLVNLQKAVDDAKTSNGAAAVRYPMAATSLLDSTKQMASIYVADIIEEKTGKRPTAGIQPGVTMDGGKVAITLNGLSQADMGKLSMSDLTSETASRTTKWVGRAMGLLGTIASTSDMLGFEDDVLAALIDGFKSNGWAPPAPAAIPDGSGGAAGATAGGGAPATPTMPKI